MKAIVFGIGGSVGSRALIMLSGVIISRILGSEYYGQFSMVNSTVTLFVTFSSMGISATLTRYVAIYLNAPAKMGNIIGSLSAFVGLMSVIMSVTLFLLSKMLSLWVSDSDVLTGYFKITSFTIFFSALASIQQSILLGMEKYKQSARIELIRCGVYIVLAGILSSWQGIYGAIWALLITNVHQFCLLYLENRREYKLKNIVLRFNFDIEIKKLILYFTIPAFAASLLVIPVSWINNSILAKQVGFGELAIFSVALQWMTMITYIPAQLGQVKPIYTDLYANKKYIELKNMFKKITISSIMLVIPIILFAVIFGEFILNLYGDGYEKGYFTFILMMIAALLITLQSQIGSLLQAIGRMWAGFILNLIWSVVIIGVFYYFRAFGSFGYALSYCIAYVIHTILSYLTLYYFWKKEGENSEGS
jgi:O-antigen/teichoic acid export membrane protein